MPQKTVVIFDDDADLLTIFHYIFEEMDWRVLSYQDCDQVVDIARNITPDLILMDNWIPSIGGIAATQLLKADRELSKIPVIYISANNDVMALSVQAGADAFIAKPFDFTELEETAKRLTGQ